MSKCLIYFVFVHISNKKNNILLEYTYTVIIGIIFTLEVETPILCTCNLKEECVLWTTLHTSEFFHFQLRKLDNLISHLYSCHLAAKHNALVSFSIIEDTTSLQSQWLIFSTLAVSTHT